MSFTNVRPGVYSDYVISSRYTAPRSAKYAGLVIKGSVLLAGSAIELTSASQGKEVFGMAAENKTLLACCDILFASGVAKVVVSVVSTSYRDAFTLLEEIPKIGVILTDATTASDYTTGKASILKSSELLYERLLFLAEDTPAKSIAMAGNLNDSRCVVTCGVAYYQEDNARALYGATALAGKILAENNPKINLNGLLLPTLSNVEALKERDIQELIVSGVTPLELCGDSVECVRGVTTKTISNGEPDTTERSINTILIIDEVVGSLRSTLKARLKGASFVAQSLDSIASQVTIELAEKKEQGLLTDYNVPRVYYDPSDPEICVIELAFGVAHVISQIHIKAHVWL